MRLATLKFYGGNLSFSAGHFTIFSATQRERVHGHNYQLEAALTAPLNEPGITFDYAVFRQKLADLCRSIHSQFLLPAQSPYLQIVEQGDHYRVTFDQKYMLLLKEDVKLMPLSNITIEELSHWFIDQLVLDKDFLNQYHIAALSVKVFNGPHHSAKAKWKNGSEKAIPIN